jgi:hypothetical protein
MNKWVVTMGIKICGHQVRWQRPIKIYNLVKASCLVLMLCAVAIPPASAADLTKKQTSTGAVVSCDPVQDQCMSAPAKGNTPQHRAQRKAGPPSMSPALALAMALGFRNVQGPLVHRDQPMVRQHNPREQQAFVLQSDGHKRSSSNAAGVRLALED